MAEFRRFGWCFCGIVFCDSSQLCSLLGQAQRAPRAIWGSPGRAVNVLATRWDKEECFSHIISDHVHFKNSFPLLLHVLSLELSLACFGDVHVLLATRAGCCHPEAAGLSGLQCHALCSRSQGRSHLLLWTLRLLHVSGRLGVPFGVFFLYIHSWK